MAGELDKVLIRLKKSFQHSKLDHGTLSQCRLSWFLERGAVGLLSALQTPPVSFSAVAVIL